MKLSVSPILFAATIAGLISMPALAAPLDLSTDPSVTTGFGATDWELNNSGGTDSGAPFSGGCGTFGGLNISDATSPGNDSDAYDNAWNIYVNGTILDAGNIVDLTGTTVTAGPVAMSGLNVTVEYFFSTTAAVGRIRPIFQNPTGSPITVTVQVPVNYGSDSSTVYEATSSGDTTVTTADRWVVSSQSGSGEFNTLVWYGPGTPAVTPSSYTTSVFNCSDPDGLGASFSVTIPAGATRSLVFFAGLGAITSTTDSLPGAISAAATFDGPLASLPAEWLTGMDGTDISEALNWEPGVAPPMGPTSVPTLSQWTLLLLSGLLAVAGIVTQRRRVTG